MRWWSLSAAVGIALECLAAATLAANAEPVIKLGIRTDARPFAWMEQVPGKTPDYAVEPVFRGFLVRLCTDGIRNAGYSFEQFAVTAEGRQGYIGPWVDGVTKPNNPVDVLCDPITITLERLERLEAYDFTPIVFVANSSFVTRASGPEPKAATEDGLTPTMCRGPDGTERQREPGITVDAGFLVGTTSEETYRIALDRGLLRAGPDQVICAVEFTSHEEGIAQLCDGSLHYYFADNDITAAYREAYNLNNNLTGTSECQLTYMPGFLRYEPYAILVRTQDALFRRRFVRAIYGLFSGTPGTPSTVESAFSEFFEGRQPSEALKVLFLINGIPTGLVGSRQGDTPDPDDRGKSENDAPSVGVPAEPSVVQSAFFEFFNVPRASEVFNMRSLTSDMPNGEGSGSAQDDTQGSSRGEGGEG